MRGKLHFKSITVAGGANSPIMVNNVVGIHVDLELTSVVTLTDNGLPSTPTAEINNSFTLNFDEPVGIYWDVAAATAPAHVTVFFIGNTAFPE